MPNPISSAVQEMVTNSLTSKFLGGNKKSEDVHQQQNKSSSSSSPFGGSAGLLGKISSTIASAVSSTNQQQVPDQQQQQMSGGHYNQSYYAGASYPQQQQQQQGTPGYPPSAGGYPQQQHQQGNPGYPPSPSAGGYPPQPQQQQPQYGPGGTPPYGTLGAYPPQQQQQAPYPTAGNIGFNVNAIPTTGGGYPPYQPNLGGFSGGPSPAPYPQQQQHHHHQQYQQAPYPASSGGYPQMQQQQQHHTQNYPQMQQHHHTPQMQQQHHHHTPQMQQQQTHSRTRSGGSPTHSRTRSGGSSTHSGGSSTHSRTRKTSGGSPTHSRTRKTSGGSPTHSRTRKTSGGSPTMATPSIRPNPNFNAQVTAELLRKAMKGLGCDKGKVIQALVNCSNSQRQEVIRTFKQMYGKDLIHDLRSELSGDFEDLILALMEHPAVCDAAQLRRAMQGIGTKEHVLIEIMTTRTNAQIHAIKMAYRQMFHADLEHDIGKNLAIFVFQQLPRRRGFQSVNVQEKTRTHLLFSAASDPSRPRRKKRPQNKFHQTQQQHKRDDIVQAGVGGSASVEELDPAQWTGNQRIVHFGPMAQRDPFFYFYPKGWDLLYPAQFGFFPYRTNKFRGSSAVICVWAFGTFLLLGGVLMIYLGYFVAYKKPFWRWNSEEQQNMIPPVQIAGPLLAGTGILLLLVGLIGSISSSQVLYGQNMTGTQVFVRRDGNYWKFFRTRIKPNLARYNLSVS
uniref:Annexin n=1 Tax=Globodera pallida TaxID=36090 RepID=A0A183BV46_GLOPA